MRTNGEMPGNNNEAQAPIDEEDCSNTSLPVYLGRALKAKATHILSFLPWAVSTQFSYGAQNDDVWAKEWAFSTYWGFPDV